MTRKLPQDPHAERAVLAALMLDDGVFAMVEGSGLQAGDFYHDKHKALFSLMVERHHDGELCDMFSIVSAINGRAVESVVGGSSYVSGLADHAPTSASAGVFAQRLVKLSTSRDLIFAAKRAEDALYNGDDPAEVAMSYAQQAQEIGARRGASREWLEPEVRVLGSLAKAERIAELAMRGQLRHVSSGLVEVDRKLLVMGGDLKITAARPGMGKTSAALQEAFEEARAGRAVAIFSLEMPGTQLDWRIAAARAGVTIDAVRRGQVRNRAWSDFTHALEELSQLPIYVDDVPSQNVNQLLAKARRLKARRPDLGLVVVDYLGLMGSPAGYERRNRNEQLGATTGPLKAMAKELDVVVNALAQLNRDCEKRLNKRPIMADIRDSGSIEQDADAIVFLYRDEYYNPDTTVDPGVAEFIIAKQRNGESGVTVRVGWQPQRTRFVDLSPREALPDPEAASLQAYRDTYGGSY